MSTRSTRASTRANTRESLAHAAAPTPKKTPAKQRAQKAAPLTDVTNTQPMMDEEESDVCNKAEPLSLASWDVDALTADKDEEENEEAVAAPVAATVAVTTVVPAEPSLICAQIDPAILALKVQRAPIIPATIPAFVAPVESRRVQLLYNDEGEQIGTQQVDAAPLPSFNQHDEEEDEEFNFTQNHDGDDDEDDRIDEIERMEMPAGFDGASSASSVEPTQVALWHAAALTKASVGTHVSSGFLPAGTVSSSAVRSIKLDGGDDDEDIPSFVFAAPASTQANITKVTGFLAKGTIDPERLQSKKIE